MTQPNFSPLTASILLITHRREALTSFDCLHALCSGVSHLLSLALTLASPSASSAAAISFSKNSALPVEFRITTSTYTVKYMPFRNLLIYQECLNVQRLTNECGRVQHCPLLGIDGGHLLGVGFQLPIELVRASSEDALEER